MDKRYSLETLARRGYRLIQRAVAGGLAFTAEPTSLQRGDSVNVVLGHGVKRNAVEAGLVCTETYAAFVPQQEVSGSDRMMLDEVAYEHWLPLGEHGAVAFTVPLDGPYSYNGQHLKLVWRVAVRARRRGVDAMRTQELQVRP